nr:MAG TPA: hypothetical protein [Caudoviricetes sp.]DAP20548.1 MAG TPA: hypothetical protein [Caudoviricetes sp.]DAP20648.1 MAG TPA: hypothetical protein [Caudoviricetes sp.]DAV35316.1 MAG TPA: hypothetical protein [Caudoviricetes sp.]
MQKYILLEEQTNRIISQSGYKRGSAVMRFFF